jgi:opacity protein-like surface antigen
MKMLIFSTGTGDSKSDLFQEGSMRIANYLVITVVSIIPHAVMASVDLSGYYGAFKVLHAQQTADNMETSSRPGIGRFVAGDDKDRAYNASVALGYQYGNGWRTEGEYVFKKNAEYTSGSTTFAGSFNHHHVAAQRLMLNAYRDYPLGHDFSVYATLGLGVAKVKSSGWQGTTARDYASNTQTNLAYAVGAGLAYSPIEQVTVDLGYRYIDMGDVESGYNNFANGRGLRDEQMKAHLVSSEISLGVRYLF